MSMNGTTMPKLALPPPAYPVAPVFGEHGTKIFNKSYAELKPPTDIGHMARIITETPIFIEQP